MSIGKDEMLPDTPGLFLGFTTRDASSSWPRTTLSPTAAAVMDIEPLILIRSGQVIPVTPAESSSVVWLGGPWGRDRVPFYTQYMDMTST